MDLVAFLQQQIGQITTVLAGNAGNQRPLHLGNNCRAFDSLAPARSPSRAFRLCRSLPAGAIL
jgi:hypothetical protein